MKYWVVIIANLFAIALISCRQDKSWYQDFPVIGSYSSPRLSDLNGDGTLDIVIGAGKNEFVPLEYGVLAINGENGELLWTFAATDQVVGSATFLDVTRDGIADVFIGGRNAQLFGIDGATGQEIWSFNVVEGPTPAHTYMRFNFYNTQTVDDQDGDGIRDLLVSNGGNVQAAPYSMNNRFPGTLAILSSKSGKILNVAQMPDSLETYMSVVLHDFHGRGQEEIIFGTGGETIGGDLYRVPLQSLRQNDLSDAIRLLKGEGHGFIAPVSLSDLNRDGVSDIIANWHGGTVYAIDGSTNHILWQLDHPNTEYNSSPTIGYFTDDAVPDIYCYATKGQWPFSQGATHFLIDGRDGSVILEKALGCSGTSSGVAFDYDSDNIDEVLISINEYDCQRKRNHKVSLTLNILDFNDGALIPLDQPIKAKNIASTPWVGDLDGDQQWDIVYSLLTNTLLFYEVGGMRIQRRSLKKKYQRMPSWGAYMGSHYDGIFGE